jgi:hypothetical protein
MAFGLYYSSSTSTSIVVCRDRRRRRGYISKRGTELLPQRTRAANAVVVARSADGSIEQHERAHRPAAHTVPHTGDT